MGLDASAYFLQEGDLQPYVDTWSEEFENNHPEDNFYWRNRYDLDSFMRNVWEQRIKDAGRDSDVEDYDGSIVEILEKDLNELQELVETKEEYDSDPIYEDDNIVIYKKHPLPDFYRRYEYTEAIWRQEYDLQFVEEAKQAIKNGLHVYYISG